MCAEMVWDAESFTGGSGSDVCDGSRRAGMICWVTASCGGSWISRWDERSCVCSVPGVMKDSPAQTASRSTLWPPVCSQTSSPRRPWCQRGRRWPEARSCRPTRAAGWFPPGPLCTSIRCDDSHDAGLQLDSFCLFCFSSLGIVIFAKFISFSHKANSSTNVRHSINNTTVYLWPWSTKAVRSSTGIFIAIALTRQL